MREGDPRRLPGGSVTYTEIQGMGRSFQGGGMWRGRGECGKKGLEKPRLGGRAFLAEAQQVQRQRGRDGTTGLTWCSLSTACAGTGWEQEGRKVSYGCFILVRMKTWKPGTGAWCATCMHACAVASLCDHVDCSLPGSSVYGTLQASVLEWAAMPSSRGSSQPRDRTCICYGFFIGRRVLYH